MDDLKNLIFALLEKCPQYAVAYDNGGTVSYFPRDDHFYNLNLVSNDEYLLKLTMFCGPSVFSEEISLTEREFMELKWKFEDWQKELKAKALDEFRELAKSEPKSMDDLLKDE